MSNICYGFVMCNKGLWKALALLLVMCSFAGAVERLLVFYSKIFYDLVLFYYFSLSSLPSPPSLTQLCTTTGSRPACAPGSGGNLAFLRSVGHAVSSDGCSAAFQVNEPKLVFAGFHFVSHPDLALPGMRVACLAHLTKLSSLQPGCLSS